MDKRRVCARLCSCNVASFEITLVNCVYVTRPWILSDVFFFFSSPADTTKRPATPSISSHVSGMIKWRMSPSSARSSQLQLLCNSLSSDGEAQCWSSSPPSVSPSRSSAASGSRLECFVSADKMQMTAPPYSRRSDSTLFAAPGQQTA